MREKASRRSLRSERADRFLSKMVRVGCDGKRWGSGARVLGFSSAFSSLSVGRELPVWGISGAFPLSLSMLWRGYGLSDSWLRERERGLGDYERRKGRWKRVGRERWEIGLGERKVFKGEEIEAGRDGKGRENREYGDRGTGEGHFWNMKGGIFQRVGLVYCHGTPATAREVARPCSYKYKVFSVFLGFLYLPLVFSSIWQKVAFALE